MSVLNGQRPLAGIAHSLRALRGRNYALFFGGQSLSLVGTWMQHAALYWLVYKLTDSKVMLGWVAFVGQIPSLLVAPLAGVLSDRWNRHRVLLATQALAMVQAGALAALALSGTIQVQHVLVLAATLGLIMSVDIPNRQAFVSQMVDRREDLPNAIALNSLSFHAARLVGPAVAGFVVEWSAASGSLVRGEGMCFLLNAVSYLAVLAAVLAMRPARRPARTTERTVLHELREGWSYAVGFAPIRYLLLGLTLLGLTVLPYTTLLPVFARDILHGDAVTQGWLLSAAGLGAIVGALYLAGRRSILGLGTVMALLPLAMGGALVVFAFSRTLWLSLAMMVLVGGTLMVLMGGCNTLLQTLVDDDKRGRVMSLYTIAFIGTTPFGSLAVGYLARHLGADWALAIDGGLLVVICLAGLPRLPRLRAQIRLIYQSMGFVDAPAAPPPVE
ncbi:MAG: enterobactin exporter EntS [Planctomycetes bacterium ADurb.Bin126]|nr:MAG: enterobactin exporter EntS [Planctomycetes bacterium ADurb.Bin126]HOD80349.1 MFS transporter [Phycisphaerae bacterium]HQL75704.1 MFS transporter [Phycisphaerae bacterium]